MGMEITVRYPLNPPNWEVIQVELKASLIEYQIRMIDQLPAFPDELPPEGWREVRLSLADGMLTIRRIGNHDRVIIWGNASDRLQQLWRQIAGILAATGSGIADSNPNSSHGDISH
ncbi:hypothetical protein [Tuwongella immobilis]|uniref:Uncharacterized protein n=1 Tax=Tuwongella immobilis TaxID=692036 RepID=A0A6C2YNU5_9BACT|nr:hypothetical protein [Tuwongella immobilis]VIP03106.1 unnamed protein product [Tuwongella immobilis]VTS03406.1 unnamed protein product [Tuwongella immobilis]